MWIRRVEHFNLRKKILFSHFRLLFGLKSAKSPIQRKVKHTDKEGGGEERRDGRRRGGGCEGG